MSTPTTRDALADGGESPDAAPLDSPISAPHALTPDLIRQRMADSLTANWPRMAHAGHAHDVADSLTDIVLRMASRSRDEASAWHDKAVQALAQRDRARASAVALEQMTAEAARLLRAGLPGQALAVLESDGRPLGPCAVHGPFDGMAPSAGSAGQSLTGLVEVVELEVDPYASQAARDAEYEAAPDDAHDPDYGRDLDDEK